MAVTILPGTRCVQFSNLIPKCFCEWTVMTKRCKTYAVAKLRKSQLSEPTRSKPLKVLLNSMLREMPLFGPTEVWFLLCRNKRSGNSLSRPIHIRCIPSFPVIEYRFYPDVLIRSYFGRSNIVVPVA